jgi:hypothetical protein
VIRGSRRRSSRRHHMNRCATKTHSQRDDATVNGRPLKTIAVDPSGGNAPAATYARISDNSITYTPVGATAPVTVNYEQKAIQELFTFDCGLQVLRRSVPRKWEHRSAQPSRTRTVYRRRIRTASCTTACVLATTSNRPIRPRKLRGSPSRGPRRGRRSRRWRTRRLRSGHQPSRLARMES